MQRFCILILLSLLSIIGYGRIVNTDEHPYYTYEEMCEDIQALDSVYGERLRAVIIGQSVDGRNIYQLQIGDTTAKNALYVHSTIHGREWMNTWAVMAFTEDYLRGWDSICENGHSLKENIQACCLYLTPMVNPDGVVISQFGFDSIQSPELRQRLYKMKGADSPSLWKANANGVDLNRNFPNNWKPATKKNGRGANFFPGTYPLCEPESQMLDSCFRSRHYETALSFHSTGSIICWNLHPTDSLLGDATLKAAQLASDITGYELMEPSEPHGLCYNYTNLTLCIPTVLIETGVEQCPLPYSEWDSVYAKNKDVIIRFVQHCSGLTPIPKEEIERQRKEEELKRLREQLRREAELWAERFTEELRLQTDNQKHRRNRHRPKDGD